VPSSIAINWFCFDMVIAVTGATGFLGQALLDGALGRGLEVRALTRRLQADRPGVTWVGGDLANREALAALCERAEAVIHVAGLVNTPDPAEFAEANVTGTLNVIAAARAAGVARLIFVSSLSAREPELSAYGASKARAEQLVMASSLDWTIVRPPTIYGPRDVDMFELFRAAKWGVVPVPRIGRSSIIHADDLSALLLALVPGGRNVSLRSFEPDDGKPGGWSHDELARAIGWALGRRPFVLRLTPAMMQWAARADLRLRGNKAKLTPDRVGYLTHPDWVVSSAAQVPTTLWETRIPTRDGLKATAQWYRENRWL
jgi:nucleoside-diphosphate-sugar epimerase